MNNVKRFTLVILILLAPASALAQSPEQDLMLNKIKVFLDEYTVEHNEREKKSGIPVEFTHEFASLPENIEKSLLTSFPNHKFTVAKMVYFHWTWYPGLHLP
jgi:hypothetical protein